MDGEEEADCGSDDRRHWNQMEQSTSVFPEGIEDATEPTLAFNATGGDVIINAEPTCYCEIPEANPFISNISPLAQNMRCRR
ncbi:MAG: hypothetical protein GTO42_07635 [Candidatus Latescibacteria bacterium]|nr:hypothetical protein [Candidatus Latescibacterota bacterium]NIO28810.1 hypothetical protein [Candidatus Latescibacterota bacterium]NIO56435.1 hypothetical protein [Candidatus Latescibacterota bacterium]NIT02485.1 hypothetical protein [Candidatus Latescibacterota bacterium]